jgi:SSS family solute:Na+ symporter
VLILITALAGSTIDSLQNGLTCIFAHDLVKIGWNPTWITRILMVLTNIPAIYLASLKYDVIALFLVADIVCATSVFPVFLGLQTTDMLGGYLKAPTELGAFAGCISGFITILVNGVVNNSEGGAFGYFWLRNGAMCALCGPATMVTFIIVPFVSLVCTYLFSYLDVMVRGERAQQPLIGLAFDKDDNKTDSEVDDIAKEAAALEEGAEADDDNKEGDENQPKEQALGEPQVEVSA